VTGITLWPVAETRAPARADFHGRASDWRG
jgi:hypothetical protein